MTIGEGETALLVDRDGELFIGLSEGGRRLSALDRAAAALAEIRRGDEDR